MSQSMVTRGWSRCYFYKSGFIFSSDLQEILHEPPNVQAGECTHTHPRYKKLHKLQLPLHLWQWDFKLLWFSTLTLHPARVIENFWVILVREAGANCNNNTGKVHSKNLNQQFDLADASFWKLRGPVCILLFFSIPAGATKRCQKVSRISESDMGQLQLKLSNLASNYYF